jgi:hypothetical protein
VSGWSELVSAALLGTERRDPDTAAPLPVERESAEERLLTRAAVTAVYGRAGVRPRTGHTPLPAAGEEALPLCSAGAALRLAAILDGQFLSVLDEWLELAEAHGVRAPDELLPALLDEARGRRRQRVLAVSGERGRWLASLNEDWRWARAGDEVWRNGAVDERRAWLRALRRRDPAAGLAALEETWGEEEPRARAGLLADLEVGRSMDDEPFLEQALDDRRQDVRAFAAALLSQLPESRLSGRMTERARPLLRVGRSVRARLEAAMPEELDAAAERDIVVVKPLAGTGKRAWWLERILAATPLTVWEAELGKSPADLVALPVGDNLRENVHNGWREAAGRQGNRAWAEALLPGTWDPQLFSLVPRDVAEQLLLKRIDDANYDALRQLPGRFGLELSKKIVRKFPIDRGIAQSLDPRVLDHLPDDAPPGVVQLLAFRHDLHKELA